MVEEQSIEAVEKSSGAPHSDVSNPVDVTGQTDLERLEVGVVNVDTTLPGQSGVGFPN